MDYTTFAGRLDERFEEFPQAKERLYRAVGEAFTNRKWLSVKQTEKGSLLCEKHFEVANGIEDFNAPAGLKNVLEKINKESGGSYDDTNAAILAYLAYSDAKYSKQLKYINDKGFELGRDFKWFVSDNESDLSTTSQCSPPNSKNTADSLKPAKLSIMTWTVACICLAVILILAVVTEVLQAPSNSGYKKFHDEVTMTQEMDTALEALRDHRLDDYRDSLVKASESGDPIAKAALAEHFGSNNNAIRDEDLANEYWAAAVAGDFIEYANEDVPEALHFLALLHRNGLVVPANQKHSIELLKRSKARGFSRASLHLAEIALENDDPKDDCWGLKHAEDAADSGHRLADFIAYRFFRESNCGNADLEEVVQRLRNSADAGVIDAQLEIARLYSVGDGVTPNLETALWWNKKAADQGSARGQYNAALEYLFGDEAVRSPSLAVKLLLQASEQGLAEAQNALGSVYRSGLDIKSDSKAAVELYRKAALQNYAPAKVNLGDMYVMAEGVAQDIETAVNWYSEAAKAGNEMAQIRLGDIYQDGSLIKGDEVEAKKWYQAAISQGSVLARVRLGWLHYESGPEGYIDAIEQFTFAAATGHAEGLVALGEAFLFGIGVQPSLSKAIGLCDQAKSLGGDMCLARAYFMTPRLISETDFPPKPRKEIADAFERIAVAANNGNHLAARIAAFGEFLHSANLTTKEIDRTRLDNAEVFLRIAAEYGNIHDRALLGLFLAAFREQSILGQTEAYNLLSQAARNGSVIASHVLSDQYLNNTQDNPSHLSHAAEFLRILVEAGRLTNIQAGMMLNDQNGNPVFLENAEIMVSESQKLLDGEVFDTSTINDALSAISK
ncbi:tetratricopeptide repeat protein [uncultured Roseobacter sp.]|uniref:tetratricopeptide repeat protein n=1 Tax=uncultured Roseobacter sp. TaxID=114847 RepID=UPI002605CBED|nr:tetratricopeptide repeat protein [uncultured Roseobacter sp.]